jgi:hypothetical protein
VIGIPSWCDQSRTFRADTGELVSYGKITKEIAIELLKHKRENRSLSPGNMKSITEVVSEFGWRFTCLGVALDENGRLSDGEHRLSVVAKTGVPLSTIVVIGMTDGARLAMDQGSRRGSQFMAKTNGIKNKNVYSAMVNLVYRYSRSLPMQGFSSGGRSNNVVYDDWMNSGGTAEILNGLTRLSANVYKEVRDMIELRPSVVGFVLAAAAVEGDKFLHDVVNGIRGLDLSSDSPYRKLAKLNKQARSLTDSKGARKRELSKTELNNSRKFNNTWGSPGPEVSTFMTIMNRARFGLPMKVIPPEMDTKFSWWDNGCEWVPTVTVKGIEDMCRRGA